MAGIAGVVVNLLGLNTAGPGCFAAVCAILRLFYQTRWARIENRMIEDLKSPQTRAGDRLLENLQAMQRRCRDHKREAYRFKMVVLGANPIYLLFGCQSFINYVLAVFLPSLVEYPNIPATINATLATSHASSEMTEEKAMAAGVFLVALNCINIVFEVVGFREVVQDTREGDF